MKQPPLPPHLRTKPQEPLDYIHSAQHIPPIPHPRSPSIDLVHQEQTPTEEPQTHEELLDLIIRTTLKPEHGTDANILRFIANYNLSKDVKQAAKESGLSAIDGRRLIQRPDIYECCQKIAAAGARKFGYDAEEVVAKVKEVIEFDPIDLINPDTGVFYEDISQVPAEARRVIKKLTIQNVYDKDPNGVVIGIHSKILKFEFWDKLKAAEMLGGEKEVFKKSLKVEHDVGSNMRETLLARIEDADARKVLKAKDVT